MKNNFDKEEFLRDIHTVPSWVKNSDDLLKFCKHLHYRLLQAREVAFWYERNFKLSDEQATEVCKIHSQYDEAYNNEKCKFKIKSVKELQ